MKNTSGADSAAPPATISAATGAGAVTEHSTSAARTAATRSRKSVAAHGPAAIGNTSRIIADGAPVAHLRRGGGREFQHARTIFRRAQDLTRFLLEAVSADRGIDVDAAKSAVSDCVRSILRNPDPLLWMGRIRRDEHTAEHCLNTGLLAIAFGRHLGVGEDDLNTLGMAGLLHDVGKMHTPPALLNKEGPLDAQEYLVMQKHTWQGRDILRGHRKVSRTAVDVAHSHHEHLDGSGYPRRIGAGAITDFTRIIMLCDVYDAITSDRSYRKGASSLEALRIIAEQTGRKFDPKLARRFTDFIGPYPPGSVVELRSGEVGVVVGSNARHRHLPRVIVVRDREGRAGTERVLDLEQEARRGSTQLIRDLLPNGGGGVRVEDYVEKGAMLS